MVKKKFLLWEYEFPKRIDGSLNLTYAGWLNDEHLTQFLNCAHRYVANENKHVYIKGMGATLLALGYDEDWVNGEFYKKALEMY